MRIIISAMTGVAAVPTHAQGPTKGPDNSKVGAYLDVPSLGEGAMIDLMSMSQLVGLCGVRPLSPVHGLLRALGGLRVHPQHTCFSCYHSPVGKEADKHPIHRIDGVSQYRLKHPPSFQLGCSIPSSWYAGLEFDTYLQEQPWCSSGQKVQSLCAEFSK